MRLQQLDGDDTFRQIGAAVVRGLAGSDVVLELGPADGPPLLRLTMSHSEAMRLISATQSIIDNGGESILIVDE